MREYIVSLNKDVDYDTFWNEIESGSNTDGFVPSRRVEIVNNRECSLRSCHYALTDEEASLLRNDPRVYSVEIPPEQRTDIQLGFRAVQLGNFNKTTSSSGNFNNWGLIRHSFNDNIYRTSTTTTQNYNYDNDGTGVDVVILDSGLQIDHPEFTDAQGVSRVQQINWYTASGISGTQNSNFYRDFDGHGTHVAGTVAGKTYGWAKNSKIYALKLQGLEGTGDSGTGISISQCFDIIKLWHTYKPVDPTLGYKRPTVLNMSFGYSTQFINITGGSYRGSSWTGNTRRTDYGMTGSFDGVNYSPPVRVGSVDVDIEELIDAGVVVCIAAGNNYIKADIPGGIDYNNYWTSLTYGNSYYNRGMSPYSSNAIIVGSLDSTSFDNSRDRKAAYSNAGEGVDIFAAGTNIISSCSNTNKFNAPAYHLNSNFKQVNISGTSMASPQIAGIASLFLQNNPNATPAQVKSWLLNNSTSTVYKTSFNNDYTDQTSQWGGDVKVSYIPSKTVGFYKGDSGKITNLTMKRI